MKKTTKEKRTYVKNSIKVSNLNKSYLTGTHVKKQVFQDFNIAFEKEKVHCVLGVSGCGKSTLLRIIAGLEEYDSGEILFDKSVTKNKDIFLTMVMQENNLLPWFSVCENIKLALDAVGDKSINDENIDEILEKHGLLEHKNYYPYELSVGLKQKVGLLKAIIIKPKILLLDEPFCALDFVSKEAIHDIFLKEFEKEKFTSILSTHYIEEAVKLGDYIHLLSKDNRSYKVFKNPLKKSRVNDKNYQEFLEFIKNEYV